MTKKSSTKKKRSRKTPRKRTDNHYRNTIYSTIKLNFARYAPTYDERLKQNRIEIPKYNKDGSLSKVPEVWYLCDSCGKKEKSDCVNVDHIEPVVEIGMSTKDYNFEEYYERINCDINNLQVLCAECHDSKTAEEQKARMEFKKKGK